LPPISVSVPLLPNPIFLSFMKFKLIFVMAN
jgi:hypothetical protein